MLDSKIQSTQQGSSIVRGYAKITSSKVSEFCSLSLIDSADHHLKSPKFHFNEGLHFFKLINFVSFDYDL